MAKKKGASPVRDIDEAYDALEALLAPERREGESNVDALRRIVDERNTYMNHSHKAFVP